MQAIAYIGQFNNGQFFASGRTIKIPEGQQVVITFLDNNAATPKTFADRKIAAQTFLQSMQELRDMGLDEDDNAAIDKLQSGKYKPHFEERLM